MVREDSRDDAAGDEPDPTQPAAPARATGDVTLILSRIEQGDPSGRRAATAARLRGTTQAGRRQDGPGEAGPDAAGHGAGA